MLVECLKQCDIHIPASGDNPHRDLALFPGQTYELPEGAEDQVAALVESGALKVPKPKAAAKSKDDSDDDGAEAEKPSSSTGGGARRRQ